MASIKPYLNKIPFPQQNLIFLSSILFCIGILFFRIKYSGQMTYSFLLWNLFLAIVPYGFSIFIYHNFYQHPKKYSFILFIFLWLLFYPNAAYIVTDFIHLNRLDGMPIWIDILILFSFSWTGLILGFASLRLVHIVFEKSFGRLYGWIFAIGVIILGSLGVYLGRYLRFNSWDSVQRPKLLFLGISERILNPSQYLGIYGMTISFSAFFILAYLSIVYFMFPLKKD